MGDMRIDEIRVSKLFNIFDHDIPLSSLDPITIVIGPNGFGKTVILRMIQALFSAKYSIFYEIPFKSFEIIFSTGESLKLMQETTPNKEQMYLDVAFYRALDKTIKLHFEYKESKRAKVKSFTVIDINEEKRSSHRRLSYSMLEDVIPGLRQIGPSVWRYLPTEEVLGLREVLDRFSDSLPSRMVAELQIKEEPEWLKDLRGRLNVRLVKADRLSMTKKKSDNYKSELQYIATVNEYSNETMATIKSKLAEYAERSQILDRTFPERIFKKGSKQEYTKAEIKRKLEELEKKRILLRDVGLLDDKDSDIDFSLPRKVEESQLSLLTVYVNDVDEKLSIFDDLANRIQLFTSILNKRFLYKRLTIARDKGFVFTTNRGEPLSPINLSSGEQHELVLIYELLFKVNESMLILIDEPELSLHVDWQMGFLQDLQEITSLNKTNIVIATHSPEIINERWDLAVELTGPDKV